MCDTPLVFAILEVLTLLRRACENEYIDEVRHSHFVINPFDLALQFSTIQSTSFTQTGQEQRYN